MTNKNISFLLMAIVVAVFSACGGQQDPSNQDSNQESLSPLDSMKQLILENPNDPDLYKKRAQLWVLQDSIKAAMDDLSRALRIDSTQDDVYNMQGDILFRERLIEESQHAYNICVETNPENTDCILKLAEIEFILENYDQSIELINAALKINEQISEAYALKGDVYLATGDSSLAASSYQTSVELDPDFFDGYIMLGLLYAGAGKDIALEYYNTALELKPQSVEALYNKAFYLQSTGFRDSTRFQQAIELYNRIEEIDETNATANFNKGYIHLEYYQNYQEAADEFSNAIAKYPGYFQAYYNRGLSLESIGRLEAARNDYKKSLALEPTYTPAALALERVLRNLGE